MFLQNMSDSYGPKKYDIQMNKEMKEAVNKKHRCWQRFIETHDPEKYKMFTRQRNKVQNMTREAQKGLEQEVAKESHRNPKKFWCYVKNKLKTTTGIADLKIRKQNETKYATTYNEKAKVLNDYFAEVFTREPDMVIYDMSMPDSNILIPELVISSEQVRTQLQKLKIDKSPGPDRIHPRVLAELKDEMCMVLASLFNSSLFNSSLTNVPQDWKTANVSTIFKKGDKSEACNYRPVSLTSIVCKVMETILRGHLLKFVMGILSTAQYGFVPGRSTVLQMLAVMDEWTKAIDEGNEIDIVYMDFQKAFDKVSHQRLLSKLHRYGISGKLDGWIKSFLMGRKQRVHIKGVYSEWVDVLSGVPQGSVLGPILFVIFINDMPNNIKSNISLFADDTKIFRILKTQEEDQKILLEDVNALLRWSRENFLPFHPDKSSSRRTVMETRYFIRHYDGLQRDITRVDCEKDLGIITDQHLTFQQHIQEKVNKANRILGIIRRTFVALDISTFRCLFKAMVRPHLEYAQSIWSPYKRKDIIAVENVLRRAYKMILGLRNSTYPERLKILNIPSMVYR